MIKLLQKLKMIQQAVAILIVGLAIFYLARKVALSFKISGCKTKCNSCALAQELVKAKK